MKPLLNVSNSIAIEGDTPTYPKPSPVSPARLLVCCRTNAMPSAPPQIGEFIENEKCALKEPSLRSVIFFL